MTQKMTRHQAECILFNREKEIEQELEEMAKRTKILRDELEMLRFYNEKR
jgi:hypothetical protein